MRIPLIAGNWKMNMNHESGKDLVKKISDKVGGSDPEVVVCCPFPMLLEIGKCLSDSAIMLGAQNMHWENSGAFTGEISADMLLELGVKYVIIGHSERRQIFSETNHMINLKVKKALEKQIVPILCIGELLNEREGKQTERVLTDQLENSLANINTQEATKIVIAYEPVWAIGTGKTATPEQAADTIGFIRGWLKEKYGESSSEKIRILYGGSVKPDNISEIMKSPDVDGALVGGASLIDEDFINIVHFKHSN
ncbi:triose-phosphate isomerase [Tindallia californiensis]|uniref:Triosephosphate isomerase n=1 Tax=Tindallia californiensis TaxID=159292 RepID=A0A1H3I8E2_9FIRM|nr:triose-phosphate isomerase [Tindallia californiensis]SDY23990.1 triosephosphate isomerase [Tindallia californiensis]